MHHIITHTSKFFFFIEKMSSAYPSLPPNLVQKQDAPNLRTEPPHQLSLRVMRLSRPSITSLAAPSHAIPSSAFPASDLHRPLTINAVDENAQLCLPATFGNIYLGQSFPAYVSLTNDSSREVAREVAVKIELQTVTQRFLLVDTTNHPKPMLQPLELLEFLLRHEIKELGIHVLVCSVNYTAKLAPSGPNGPTKDERRFFRKFYKFQVLNPLAVKTKVNSRVDGRVFLEVQVQNITTEPMLLDRLHMEPVQPFKVKDLNTVIAPKHQGENSELARTGYKMHRDVDESVFGETEFLQPQDIRQYLYLLTPKTPDQLLETLQSNTLGKLDIVWKFMFGETGRLQTSQLTRRVPAAEMIQVITKKVHGPVRVERPFKVDIRVVNRTDSMMKIQLSAVKAKMGAVLLRGHASRTLGEVYSGSGVDVTLEFLPLVPGLHAVGGVRVSDYISGESRDIELAEVFVAQHELENVPADLMVGDAVTHVPHVQ
jgi:hypothetical protein